MPYIRFVLLVWLVGMMLGSSFVCSVVMKSVGGSLGLVVGRMGSSFACFVVGSSLVLVVGTMGSSFV